MFRLVVTINTTVGEDMFSGHERELMNIGLFLIVKNNYEIMKKI